MIVFEALPVLRVQQNIRHVIMVNVWISTYTRIDLRWHFGLAYTQMSHVCVKSTV